MRAFLLRVTGAVLTALTLASPAAAQFELSFRSRVPVEPPSLGGSFGVTFCTVLTPTINFPDAASFTGFVTANCPAGSIPPGFNGLIFGLRATGIFSAATAGVATFSGLAAGGTSIWVNGMRVRNAWFEQSGPYSFSAALTEGPTNTFQLDYFASTRPPTFWTLDLPPGVTVVQPTTSVAPEPATAALLATGLAALAFAARRQRR